MFPCCLSIRAFPPFASAIFRDQHPHFLSLPVLTIHQLCIELIKMNPEEGNTPNGWQGKRPYSEFMAWARSEEDEKRNLVTINEPQFESLDLWTLHQKNCRLQNEVMRLISCIDQEKERAIDMQNNLETQKAITGQAMDTAFKSNTIANRLMTENQRLTKEVAKLVAANIKLSHEVEALKLSQDKLTMAMNANKAKHVVDDSIRAEDMREKTADVETVMKSPPRKAITSRVVMTENERLLSENGALKKELIAHKKCTAQAVAENKRLSREIEIHKHDKKALGRELHAQVMNDSREAQGLASNERPLLNSAESHAAQIRIDSLLHENKLLRSDKDVLTRRLNAKVAYENRAAQAFAENKKLLSNIEALTSKLNAKVALENRAAQAVAENTRLLGDIKALTIENAFYRSSQAYANPGYGSIAAPLMAENRRLSSENEALKHRSTELMMQLHAEIGEERKS